MKTIRTFQLDDFNSNISWPAVIKFHGDDELLFINDAKTWMQDRDFSQHRYDAEDRLIDVNGNLFSLSLDTDNQQVKFLPCDAVYSTVEFCELLKAHFLCLNQCCIPKLHISSLSDGMSMLQNQLD